MFVSPLKWPKNIFLVIAYALDQVNCQDCTAMFAAGAMGGVLGLELSNLTSHLKVCLSCTGIPRCQASTRLQSGWRDSGPCGHASFWPEQFWLVAGCAEEGMGETQAVACIVALYKWSLHPPIQGIYLRYDHLQHRSLLWGLYVEQRRAWEGTLMDSWSSSCLWDHPLKCLRGRFWADGRTWNRTLQNVRWSGPMPTMRCMLVPLARCSMTTLEEQCINVVSYEYIQQAMKEHEVWADYAKFLSLSWGGGGVTSRLSFIPQVQCITHSEWGRDCTLWRSSSSGTCSVSLPFCWFLLLFVSLTYIHFWNEALPEIHFYL